MTIKERIEKISQYFKEMQITTVNGKQVIYVVVSFPRNWIIDESIEEKFGIAVSQGTNLTDYYFCADIDSGEDVLFDAIDYNIEKMKEAIERAQLLSIKTKELKSLFEDENITIEELRSLTISIGNSNNLEKEFSDILITQKQQPVQDDTEEKEEQKENKKFKKNDLNE